MDVISNPNLTEAKKAEALARQKKTAEYNVNKQKFFTSSNPAKILSGEYRKQQRIQTQTTREAQVYMQKLSPFRNQKGFKDTNLTVSSPMQAERYVTLSDGTSKNAPHGGTDLSTYTGRKVFSPVSGTVLYSGFESTMGNYVMIKTNSGGYILYMHLQSANLAKAGQKVTSSSPIGHAGDTGSVEVKGQGVGCLHVEYWDKNMRRVNPKQFVQGGYNI